MSSNMLYTEENEKMYEAICQKFRKYPSIYQFKTGSVPGNEVECEDNMAISMNMEFEDTIEASKPQRGKYEGNTTTNTSALLESSYTNKNSSQIVLNASMMSRAKETHSMGQGSGKLRSLQKTVINGVCNSSKIEVKDYPDIDSSTVCSNIVMVVNDDTFLQVCKKSITADSRLAKWIGILVILPKLCQLSNSLSSPLLNGLVEFVSSHSQVAVDFFLQPFFSSCPALLECHVTMITHLVHNSSQVVVTQMLWALSGRKSSSEEELKILQLLCEKCELESSTSHSAVITFMTDNGVNYKTSIRFGRCLLFVVQKMGQHMMDLEPLCLIVAGHSSSMKKSVEIQLRKIKR